MAGPTFVNGAGTDGTPVTAFLLPIAQTAGNTLVVVIALHGLSAPVTPTVIDSAGNSYTVFAPAAAQDTSSSSNGVVFAIATGIAAKSTNTNTITFGSQGTATLTSIAVLQYTASAGSDGTPSANIVTGTAPVVNYTTNNANVTVLEAVSSAGGATAATSPWTDRAQTTNLGDNFDVAEQAVTTSGTVVSTAFNGVSGRNCIVVLALKSSGPAAPPASTFFPVQQRAPGFPPSAPLPGIPRLGSGVLRSPPTPPPARNPPLNLGTQRRAPGFPPNAPIPGIPLLGQGVLRFPVPYVNPHPPAPPLRTQERAKGFPPRAPLPGIARLGVGVLQAPPVTATNVNATIAQNLGGLTQSATASQTIPASAAQRVGGLVQAAAAAQTIATSAAQRLGGLVQSATAAQSFATTIAQHLGGLRQSASAAQGLAAAIAQRLGGLVQAAAAAQTIAASIAQRLGGLRQSASASTGTSSGPLRQVLGERLLTAQALAEGTIIDHAQGAYELSAQRLGEGLLAMQATGERATIVQVTGEQT